VAPPQGLWTGPVLEHLRYREGRPGETGNQSLKLGIPVKPGYKVGTKTGIPREPGKVGKINMGTRPCTICSHPKHAEVDADLTTGAPLIPTAAKYGLSKSAVGRHRNACLAPRLAAAARIVQPTKALQAPVQRAKAIAAGATASVDDILSLSALMERMARSLERLENGAISAADENLHAAHAGLAAQLHRGIESVGKLRGYYNDSPAQSGAERFSISINLPQIDTAPTSHPMVDVTPKSKASTPAPRIPSKDFGVTFDLGDSLNDALDAAEALTED
jgi:hypothetical protein